MSRQADPRPAWATEFLNAREQMCLWIDAATVSDARPEVFDNICYNNGSNGLAVAADNATLIGNRGHDKLAPLQSDNRPRDD